MRGNTEQTPRGVDTMPTTWTEAPAETTAVDKMIKHLADHGVLDEAERVFDRLDNDTETSPILTPSEVRERLAKYCK